MKITTQASYHSCAKVELREVENSGTKWIEMEFNDDDGYTGRVSFFGTDGKLLNRPLRAAEKVCDALRADLEADRLVLSGERAELEAVRELLDGALDEVSEATGRGTVLEGKLEAALADAAEADETRKYSESLLADATSEVRTMTDQVEQLTQETAARREEVENLTAELRTVNAAYESAQERGLV